MTDTELKVLENQIEWFTKELWILQDLYRQQTGRDYHPVCTAVVSAESSYTPGWCPALTFHFNFSPAEPTTFNDPGCPAEVELTRVEVHGVDAGPELEDVLFEHLGDRVEGEIINGRDGALCEAGSEAAIESWEVRRLERGVA